MAKIKETCSLPCAWLLQGNLRYWLEEAECRDQYSVISESGDRTSIFWNDVKDPVSIEERAVGVCCRAGTHCWVSLQRRVWWEFPGGPVVRTLHFHCHGPGFDA